MTIGDSWAWLIANGAPGSAVTAPGYGNSLQTVLNAFHPGVTVANESFMGGTAAQHAASLADITARINAHPTADIVWLSSGGNDMLLGQLGGGYTNQLSPAQKNALYDTIGANVNTVVNHILSIRPDLQVVIEGYDYINVWDTVTGSAGDTVRANLGIIKSGFPILDITQNAQLNQAFRDAESRKAAIGDASRRVTHIQNFGLNSSVSGYTGYFGTLPGQGFYPPDLWPDLPTKASLMGNTDPIHLNTQGYTTLAVRAEQAYLNTALQPGALTTNTTSLNFGHVLVGGSASQDVTATNAGPNYTKVTGLAFPASSGEFTGAAQSFNPLFQDPTLGSDSAVKSYGYAPTGRGADSQNLLIASNQGTRPLVLAGTGVAPVNAVNVTGAPLTRVGTTSTATVTVQNVGDGNLSGQGAASNLSGALGAPAGNAAFSGSGAAIGLADGGSQQVQYTFTPITRGAASATVAVNFTNGNTLGNNAAQTITSILTGAGVGPEFHSSLSTIDFGARAGGSLSNLAFNLSNISADANGGNAALTNLTLLSASITGPDAGLFSLNSFTPGTVLQQSQLANLSVDFSASGAAGPKSAMLTFSTDQGAALGGVGQSFSIDLSGSVGAAMGPTLLSVVTLGGRQVLNFDAAGNSTVVADSADGLLTPLGAARDAAGNVYVADSLLNKIFKIDPAGNTSTFAAFAQGVVTPAGLALGADGNLRVANYLANTITSHNASGAGTTAAGPAQGVNHPFDVALDAAGNTYVANLDTKQILKIDALGASSVFADASDGLFTPLAVAVDGSGNVYVADVLTNTIRKFDPAGNGSLFADAADGLITPTDLAFDASGNLYVTNYLGNSIYRFNSAGVGTLFASGLNQPWGLSAAVSAPSFAGRAVPEPASVLLFTLGAALAAPCAWASRQRTRPRA